MIQHFTKILKIQAFDTAWYSILHTISSSNPGVTSKKKDTLKSVSFFLGSGGSRPPPLRKLKCSGQVNCPCAKVLLAAKRLYGANAPPRRAGPHSCPASILCGQGRWNPCNRNGYRFFSMPDRYGFLFIVPVQVWEIESAWQRCWSLLYASIKSGPMLGWMTKVR